MVDGKSPVEAYQEPQELQALVQMVEDRKPKSILEVGSMFGGTLWYWLKLVGKGGKVVAIDLAVAENDWRHTQVMASREMWPDWAKSAGAKLVTIFGKSQHAKVVDEAKENGPYDFIFIDGAHDRKSVEADFENFYPMLRPGGIMAIHDVAVPDHNEHMIETGTWWREFEKSGEYNTSRLEIKPEAWGIGLVHKPEDSPVSPDEAYALAAAEDDGLYVEPAPEQPEAPGDKPKRRAKKAK